MTIKIGWGWIVLLPILLKLFGIITISWWIVLIPVWVPLILLFLISLGAAAGRN